MDETIDYYATAIHSWVWSGFYTPAEVADRLAQQLADDEAAAELAEAQLQNLVSQAFAAKHQAEATWPAVTDCDRLVQAFAALNARGIIALENAGYDMSEGLAEVAEALASAGPAASAVIQGYCFYHGQDLERAVMGHGLWLAYGSLDNQAATKRLVGAQVQAALQEVGLVVEWSGDPAHRLQVISFAWHRRTPKLS